MIYKLLLNSRLRIAKTVLAGLAVCSFSFMHAQKPEVAQGGWKVKNPFVHNVFIENKGQFIEQVQKGVGNKILYYSHKGHIHIYFTPAGVTFEHDSAYIAGDGKREAADDGDAKVTVLPLFMHINWDGANTHPDVEVQIPEGDYFTYPNPKDKGHSSVLAHAWKKLIYHNLYNNIDVEFYYPDDNSGLEYDIIVHPGGDLSQVKMHYSNNASLNLFDHTLYIKSPIAHFVDRTPIAKDADGKDVFSDFRVKDNVVSFYTGDYDKSKTLIIDPLLSTTSFTGTNKAYDLQYDLVGNVYVMGGGDATEYQLQKYSGAGTLSWTYTATFSYTFRSYYYYGGFATDNRSGSSFVPEGLDYSGSGCLIVKVNNAGGVVTTFPGSTNVNEIWRMAYDYCDNQIIIGAGEGSSAVYQGATMDTNCSAVNAVNVLGAPAGSTHHDIAMITFDGVGKCYFATTTPASSSYTGYENVLLQMPSLTLAPTAYQVTDRSWFIETASIPYYPSLPSPPYLFSGNGFNGLIADLNLVATYDGNKLRTWTPATGAIIDSVTVTPNTQLWGGIALDCQDNIYVGNYNKVAVYSKALALTSTLTLTSTGATDTIYDFHIAPNNTLYACGDNFVSGTPLTLPKMVTTSSTSPVGCGCTGTASATVCDNYPYTYSWSNGATTSSLSGLCPGKYLLTVKDASCNPRQDTATITITGSGGLTATSSTIDVLCNGGNNGSASATATSGTSPYTYSWTTGATTSAVTNLTAGSYTCVVKDAAGCIDTLKMVITQPTPLTLSTVTFPATCFNICNGQATVVPAGGTTPYTYTWSNGGTTANVNNLCVDSTYTITVTDKHGCTHDTAVSVTTPTAIVVTKTVTPALCGKTTGAVNITASGGTPGYTYLWNTGTTTQNLTNVNADIYCVTVTDANGCTDTACVTVTSTPGDSIKVISTTNELCNGGSNGSATASAWGGTTPYTYAWSPTGGTSTTASNLTAGTYTVRVTDSNGCVNLAYATITEPPPIVVTVPQQMICIGQTATLTASASGGTTPYSYLWNGTTTGATYSVSPTTTTVYSVKATDANGCSTTINVTVVVRDPLIVVAGPPAKMCPGGSVTLFATGAGGDSIYTYTWQPGGLTGSSITVSPTTTTVYTVTITDACGTPSATDTVPVIIYPAPVVAFTADTLLGCSPLCVKFTDQTTVASGNITGWYWTFGDGGTSRAQDTTYCYNNAGTFTVTLNVTTNNGCTGSLTKPNYITVFAHPKADFTAQPQPTNLLNSTIYFTDQSTDIYGIVSWDWTFGDATDSTEYIKNGVHTYQDTGTFCPWLVVTNKHGCVDSTQKCIEIQPYWTIYVPNAFTPNANGRNDVFAAKGVGIIAFQMWIFDRWGMQIYHGNQMYPYGGWDGIVQGGSSHAIAQEDTYVWLIECTDVFHKDHRLIGRVTLIK